MVLANMSWCIILKWKANEEGVFTADGCKLLAISQGCGILGEL